MGLNTVQEIERAISTLTPQELEELYTWFDQHPLDTRIQSDLAAGRQTVFASIDGTKQKTRQNLPRREPVIEQQFDPGRMSRCP